MTGKPKPPTRADYVRGDRAIINQNWQAVSDYKKLVFDSVAKEFGETDAYDLVILLAERYHKPFKVNQTRGPKKKWTPELKNMVAALIELRYSESPKRSIDEDIENFLEIPLFQKFAMSHVSVGSDHTGHEAIKDIHKKNKSNPLCKAEIEKYHEDPDLWAERFVKLTAPFIKKSNK